MYTIGVLAATIMLTLAGQVPAAVQDTAAQIARGKVVYQEQRCRMCHSIAGEGNRRYPLDGIGSRLSAAAIHKWIVAPREMNPKVRKPSYEKLPPADIAALVVYLRSLRQAPAGGG